MYIGVDLGTSGLKILLVKETGQIVRTITKSYELIIQKASWSEQDPNQWYSSFLEGLQEVVIGYEDEILGISFSGQMHGLVILDENDNVLRNAILWNDQRTIQEVEYLNETVGLESLLEYTGNIALTGLTAPKLLWVKHNEPEIFSGISKIMLPKDYLAYKLSGSFSSDVTDLSGTLYFDPKTRQYSNEMLDIIGIDRSMLPEVHESYDVIGTIVPELKAALHLKNDVKVIIGGGDQAVGAVGVGIVGSGECSISLGTSGVIFVSSNQFVIDSVSHFQSYAHANGKYHIMAVMLNAAGAIKWWNEQVLQKNDYDGFYDMVMESKIDEELFFLPYLTGERAPINDPYAKGVIYGLGIHHTQQNLNRAIVEGVTFALKDSFTKIQKLGVAISQVRITGGGARSRVWAQMIADVMNVEVAKIQTEEGPALGAAILAMVGCKVYPDVAYACNQIVSLSERFYPDATRVHIYQEKYLKFIQIYPEIKKLYKQIN